jgi:hypothetical protein
MEDKVAETAVAVATPTNVDASMHIIQQATASSLYLMGFSFIIGSGFTILMLMLLDYMRMRRVAKAANT